MTFHAFTSSIPCRASIGRKDLASPYFHHMLALSSNSLFSWLNTTRNNRRRHLQTRLSRSLDVVRSQVFGGIGLGLCFARPGFPVLCRADRSAIPAYLDCRTGSTERKAWKDLRAVERAHASALLPGGPTQPYLVLALVMRSAAAPWSLLSA
ncbi:uncharacterized protein IWZ02DRAFT_165281 [Phyllosticta citriasiana]|uniref:Uncharacterized protein n=1 Tax=Phyllosticta citriasiana TaxID=595635 RepID=A0ABR1K7Q3_9PEZI